MRERPQKTETSSKFSIQMLEFKSKPSSVLQLKYSGIKEITVVKVNQLLKCLKLFVIRVLVLIRLGVCSCVLA